MMNQKANLSTDEIEAALNRQIQVADQVRSDMRQLITTSFAEAIHPALDDAEKRIGRSITDATKAINEFGSRVKEPLAGIQQILGSIQSDILNIPERLKTIIDKLSLHVNENVRQTNGQLTSIAEALDLLERTQNELNIIIGKVDGDLSRLKTEAFSGLEMRLAALGQIVNTYNTDIPKIVAGNIEVRMNVLGDQINEMGKMLRNQRILSWLVMVLCGSALSLLAWVAFRGM
jgi:uncharacterized phage infection (PIP) family protein YhgE